MNSLPPGTRVWPDRPEHLAFRGVPKADLMSPFVMGNATDRSMSIGSKLHGLSQFSWASSYHTSSE